MFIQPIPLKSFRKGWKPKQREISIPLVLLIFTGFNALCGGLIFVRTMFSTNGKSLLNFKYGKKKGKYKGIFAKQQQRITTKIFKGFSLLTSPFRFH